MPNTLRARRPSLAKLSVPRLGRVFPRDRLFQTLDAWAAAPGLWIAGPPGAGKTTLVSTWLEARDTPAIWLQLDAADADVAAFAHYLEDGARPLAGRRALRLPRPSPDDLRDTPAFVRRLMRQLAATLPLPWTLVLDNLQEVGPASELHAGLAASLSELPAGSRWIALSREPPSPAYARPLAGQQLACLPAAALRFTTLEATELVRLHEAGAEAAALCEAADGWAAAMILLLARPGGAPAQAGGAPVHGLAAGADTDAETRQRLFDLFASEVLDGMPVRASAALARIAFLPSATAAAAQHVSGDPDAGALLEDLARRSLFTDRRDGAVPSYTFHALFGACLRARAAASLPPEALLDLQTRAAGWLEAEGRIEAAVALLLDARDWAAAVALLSRQAGHVLAQGRTVWLHDTLSALPDAWRMAPQPSYWLGMAELARAPKSALDHLERAYRGYTDLGDDSGAFQAACAAADAIIFMGARYDTLKPWMPVLERHAPAYLAQRTPEVDLRVLPGLVAAFVNRDPGHALTAELTDAAEEWLDATEGASQRLLLSTLAYYLLWTGQTPRLDRMLARIDRLSAHADTAPATLLRWYGVSVLIRSLLGRVPEALAEARRALALTAGAPAPMRVKAELMMVLAALSSRDADLTRRHLAQAASVLETGSPIDVTTYDFQRGMLMLLDGDWASAAQLMRASVPSGRASGWPLREHIALLGQSLGATQVGALDEAESALQAALAHPFHKVCRWHHWIAGLIEAHLAERLGDRPRALGALSGAIAVAREHGFDFGPMPFCCGDMMPRLAALALAHAIDPPFVERMIQRHGLLAPDGADEAWPWPVRVRTLGRFQIERIDAPAAASRKESRKPLELLKLLVALGGHGAPVARLCDALWPDASGDAARNAFDNTLHRLRKLLGGDHHLLLSAGALSLNVRTCWTDLWALDLALTEAEAMPGGPTGPEPAARAAPLVDRILALYQGDFLAGEDGSPELLAARNRLQARFIRQIGALGATLEASGHRAAAARLYQRVVEQQPLAEDVVRRLIACLLAMGLRAEALVAYRRCRQQMSVLLGLAPSPETQALVSGLRDP